MAERYREREVKLDVDEAFGVPELNDLVPAGGALECVAIGLDSTYFDTAEHDLLSAKLTLRRRVGDPADSGWQLKIPAGGDRTEVRLPPTETVRVPKELRDLTTGMRRGRPLRQVARIRTERTAYRLFDAAGDLLVEIADDRVHAATLGEAAVLSTWREVEVELGAGKRELQRRIAKRLVGAGARPSGSASKLGQVLGEGSCRTQPRRGTVGELVTRYLLAQRQALRDGDLELRSGANAIHQTRVATRRFRSTLRTYGSVFDDDRAAALDAELAWYAGVLGAVRDVDVLRAHLHGAILALPDHLVLGPVASSVDTYLAGERDRHQRTLLRTLNGRRYFALLDDIDQWLADPPFTAKADRSVSHAAEWADRAKRKLGKRLSVVAAEDGEPANVHRARKAAKRARYAVELAAPALPAKRAKRTVKRLKKLQDTLGEFQDSVVANETLLRLGARAAASPNDGGFTYGLLYALEQRRADVSRRKVIDKFR